MQSDLQAGLVISTIRVTQFRFCLQTMSHKNKTTKLSPHNSRIFSASINILVGIGAWGALVSIISLNALMVLQSSPLQNSTKTGMTSQPDSASRHITLAQKYWSFGQPKLAHQELTIAQEIYISQKNNSKNVLGMTTEPLALYEQWEKETGQNTAAFDFWKTIVNAKPNYRDGYLQLASISYELGNYTEAEKYVDDALNLDPNSTTAHELKTIISSITTENQNSTQ